MLETSKVGILINSQSKCSWDGEKVWKVKKENAFEYGKTVNL